MTEHGLTATVTGPAEEIRRLLGAPAWEHILWDVDQECRNVVKWGEVLQEVAAFADKIRELIADGMIDAGLTWGE